MFWFTRNRFVGIALGLDLRQPVVVVAVGRLHPLLALVHHEVDVGAAGRVRVGCVPVADRPVGDRPAFAGSGSTPTITSAHVHVAVGKRGVGVGHVVHRAVDRVEVHGRLPGRHLLAPLRRARRSPRRTARARSRRASTTGRPSGRARRTRSASRERHLAAPCISGVPTSQHRRHRLRRVLGAAVVVPHDPRHLAAVQLLRERRRRRHGQEGEEAVQLAVGRGMNSR